MTGDESLFHHKQVSRKLSNKASMYKRGHPPSIVRRNKFGPGTLLSIFLKLNCRLFLHRPEKGQTIDHQYYIKNSVRPLIDEIRRDKPSFGTRDIKIYHHVPFSYLT